MKLDGFLSLQRRGGIISTNLWVTHGRGNWIAVSQKMRLGVWMTLYFGRNCRREYSWRAIFCGLQSSILCKWAVQQYSLVKINFESRQPLVDIPHSSLDAILGVRINDLYRT
jgi:hypothetical protein